MKAEKDKRTGKWLIQYRYTDWQGNRKKSTKRGFNTKREAEEWLRQFLRYKIGRAVQQECRARSRMPSSA
ncbi:Uncharacterised protein [Streptococcus pasteurianus]|nr:Uncharacterised protein [Streptococcus pasteurianus]